MVLRTEIEAYLRSLPAEVHLTPYGNINGRGSLVSEPPCPKEDYARTAELFDLSRITSAIVQIPDVFRKQNSYSQATSYGLKHVLEQRTGQYITNGDFIVAMALSGFAVKWQKDGESLAVNPVIRCKLIRCKPPVTCA